MLEYSITSKSPAIKVLESRTADYTKSIKSKSIHYDE